MTIFKLSCIGKTSISVSPLPPEPPPGFPLLELFPFAAKYCLVLYSISNIFFSNPGFSANNLFKLDMVPQVLLMSFPEFCLLAKSSAESV